MSIENLKHGGDRTRVLRASLFCGVAYHHREDVIYH